MMLIILLFAYLSKGAFSQSTRGLLPFEPIQYVKSQVSSVHESSVWTVLNEAGPQEISELSLSMKSKIRGLLQGGKTNVIFAKGQRLLVKHTHSNEKTLVKFPNANLLALLSVSITILLENFKSSVVSASIGDILKGSDLKNPLIAEHKSLSLSSILNMVTTTPLKSESVLKSKTVVNDLSRNGEVALYFVNSILGSTANEAWMDAMMAFGIENFSLDSGKLKLSLHDIFQYALTVIHDFHTMTEVPNMDLPLQDQRYLYGWWVNCPKTTDICVFPKLPRDLFFSLSPTLRMYVSPSYEITLLILAESSDVKAVEDMILEDTRIWEEIYASLISSSTLEGTEASGTFEATETSKSTATSKSSRIPTESHQERQQLLTNAIRQVWPILVFIFWVVSSHIWVYWMFYCCWLGATRLSKKTHIARPETAGGS